jgi:Camelysin metallo-endopeptidase
MKRALGTMRGKVALSAVSLVVLAVAGVAAFSAFSSTQATGVNTFGAGSVDLASNATGSVLFNMPNMNPGDTQSECATVTYSGTLPANVSMFGNPTGALAPELNTTITRGTFPGAAPANNACTGFVPDTSGSGLFSNTLDQLNTSASPLADPGNPWATNDVHVYKITVTLDPAVPTADQGDTAGVTLTWQSNNV